MPIDPSLRSGPLFAAIASVGLISSAHAANITSNFVTNGVDHPRWSEASHWAPATVPNNGGGNTYDVTVKNNGDFPFVGPQLDVNATINNLTLIDRAVVDPDGSPFNLTVLGTTTQQLTTPGSGAYGIIHTNPFSTWKLGTLTNAAGGNLTGGYIVDTGSTLVANNANITTLGALLSIGSGGAKFVDQNGLDALRNLRTISNAGHLENNSRNFTTAGNFTNDGQLWIRSFDPIPSTFTVNGSLTNYDAATHTLEGGFFGIGSIGGNAPARLVVPNIDVRTLNSSLFIVGNGAIVDQNGNSAFRNLSSNNGNVSYTSNLTVTPQTEDGTPTGFENNGTVSVLGGVIVTVTTVFTSNGTVILSNPSSAGALIQANGGLVTTSQSFLNGHGTVYSDLYFHNEGHIAPGFSPGAITLDAPTTLGEESNVDIQLGGTTAEDEYDVIHLAANRTLDLGGALNLSLIDEFEPELYAPAVTIIDSEEGASINGRFATVSNVGTGQKRLAVIYVDATDEATGKVDVVAAVAGDSNVDGNVDFRDLVVLAQNYNQLTGQSWQTADFNGDGATTFEDLVSLAQNYNFGTVLEGDSSSLRSGLGAGAVARARAGDPRLDRGRGPQLLPPSKARSMSETRVGKGVTPSPTLPSSPR